MKDLWSQIAFNPVPFARKHLGIDPSVSEAAEMWSDRSYSKRSASKKKRRSKKKKMLRGARRSSMQTIEDASPDRRNHSRSSRSLSDKLRDLKDEADLSKSSTDSFAISVQNNDDEEPRVTPSSARNVVVTKEPRVQSATRQHTVKVDGKAPNIFSVHAIANKWMDKSLNRRIGQNRLRIKKGVPIPLEKVYG